MQNQNPYLDYNLVNRIFNETRNTQHTYTNSICESCYFLYPKEIAHSQNLQKYVKLMLFHVRVVRYFLIVQPTAND